MTPISDTQRAVLVKMAEGWWIYGTPHTAYLANGKEKTISIDEGIYESLLSELLIEPYKIYPWYFITDLGLTAIGSK